MPSNRMILILTLMLLLNLGWAKTIENYIAEAKAYEKAGALDSAIAKMEEAIKKYPENSDAYTQLGIFISNQAQRAQDFSEILKLAEKAFTMWSKALLLDSTNITARFYRGIWSVMIPKFVGMLEIGISDLENLAKIFEQSSDPAAKEQLIQVYQYLTTGYQKKGDIAKAKQMYKKLIENAAGTTYAEEAQRNLDNISRYEEWLQERNKNKKPDIPMISVLKGVAAKHPERAEVQIEIGSAYYATENYEAAEEAFKQAIKMDSLNVQVYKLLAQTLQKILAQGYDPRVTLNTDFRTNLVFETMLVLDKAVNLAPKDIELRLERGIDGVVLPFFLDKLEQAIEDLQMVLESDTTEEIKAQALYWLGSAYQKKAMTFWTKIVKQYPSTDAAQDVFDALNSGEGYIELSQYKKPFVVIDFNLGFRDELAPQTVVWVEDKDSNFVKTIYVSGFSGYARDEQINLPLWARASKFTDVDGVTGASIDLGHHTYIWDLKDFTGKKVKPGEYIVKVETAYWPSMQYQCAEALIRIEKKETRVVKTEGHLIPYLEVKYIK